MFDYLAPKDGPVVDGLESLEIVYAKDQPEYTPLRTLRNPADTMGGVVSRWTLTETQRKAVAEGADVFLELSTFDQPLQPIRMAIGDGKIECPTDAVFSLGVQSPTSAVDNHDSEFTKAVGIKEG